MAMRQVCCRHDRQRGVTLVEQIMAVTIIGVLAAIAAPSLAGLLRHNEMQVAQTEVIAALQHARGVAITSGQPTLFCPSRDGARCSSETRWDPGWLIGHDQDRDGQPDTTPLRARATYGGITILGDSGRPFVRFRSDGSASGMTNTLRICSRGRPDRALVVVISNAGRVRGATASAADAASCAAAQ